MRSGAWLTGSIMARLLSINPLHSFFAVTEQLLQARTCWSRRSCPGCWSILRPSAGRFGRAHGKSLGNIPCVTNWEMSAPSCNGQSGLWMSRSGLVRCRAAPRELRIRRYKIWRSLQTGTRSITFQLDWRLTTRPMKQSTRWLVPGPSEDQSGENDARKRSSRAVPTSHGMSCQQNGCQQGSRNLTENAAGIFRLFLTA